MKTSIEVSKEQFKKLDEMCKYFYTEKYFMNIENNILFVSIDGNIFHWFELCFTHLPMRIFCALSDKEASEDWSGDDKMFCRWDYFNKYYKEMKGLVNWINPEHPIDYLYGKFMELFQ